MMDAKEMRSAGAIMLLGDAEERARISPELPEALRKHYDKVLYERLLGHKLFLDLIGETREPLSWWERLRRSIKYSPPINFIRYVLRYWDKEVE
jgi:hypothetical protein